jgi:Protein of unknown function (DUF4199)
MIQQYKFEIKWAIIFAAASLVWTVVEKGLGWHGPLIAKHELYTLFFMPVAFVIYAIALLAKKKELGGYMTWKEGLVSGTVIGAVVALLAPVTQVITHKVISPEYFPNVIAYAVQKGKTSQADADAFFNLPSYIFQSSIGAVLAGLVTAAIVSVFVRKERPSKTK